MSVVYLQKLPEGKKVSRSLGLKPTDCPVLIYDQVLEQFPAFLNWRQSFSNALAVKAGEDLKSISSLAEFLEQQLLPLIKGRSRLEIVLIVVGGGSVGDFGGFLASVLKRGVRWVHIPTTWLAAMDSAHGGKTALNIGGFKNQIGTFYPAAKVLIVRELLQQQTEQQLKSALGELFKAGIIGGGSLYQQLKRWSGKGLEDFLWKTLPLAISVKNKVVKKDPLETKGERMKLNLGHTLGHALEAQWQMPHGLAVALGLRFSLAWSAKRKLLSIRKEEELQKIWSKLFEPMGFFIPLQPMQFSPPRLESFFLQDKKAQSGQKLNFVFVSAPGRTKVDKVSIADLMRECARQGWLA